MFPKLYLRRRTFSLAVFSLMICFCALAASARKDPPERPIDLNAANIKELEELAGVGPTTAQAIVDFREKNGRFKRVEDLLVIRGISAGKLEKMRPYLTIGAAPKPPQAPAPAPANRRTAPEKPQAHPAAPATAAPQQNTHSS